MEKNEIDNIKLMLESDENDQQLAYNIIINSPNKDEIISTFLFDNYLNFLIIQYNPKNRQL